MTIYEHDCRQGPILLDQEDADWVLEKYSIFVRTREMTNFGPYFQVLATDRQTRKQRSLGRVLLEPPDGLQVDHINQDGRDNRRKNLRVVTQGQNTANSRRISRTGYRGVDEDPTAGRWHGVVRYHRQRFYGPWRRTSNLAALDYNRMTIALYGRQMILNEVPCYAEYPIPSDTPCLFCNASCACCCVCRDEPSAGMARLLKLAESASMLSI